MKLWKVTKIDLTDAAKKHGREKVYYPYHVEGSNLETGEHFSWIVPGYSLDNERYDLSDVVVPK